MKRLIIIPDTSKKKKIEKAITPIGLFLNNLFFMMIGMVMVFGALSLLNTDTRVDLQSFLSLPVYKVQEVNFHNDTTVMNVTELCYSFEQIEQIECVINFVGANYNYILRNESSNQSQDLLKTPTDFFAEGGVCRDIAITYATIFRNLGWNTNYEFSRNHIYNKVYNEYYTCYIDGSSYSCFRVKLLEEDNPVNKTDGNETEIEVQI